MSSITKQWADVTERDEPAAHQNIKQRGRVRTPPKKAWLFDCKDKSLTMHNWDDLENGRVRTTSCHIYLTINDR